MGREGEQTPENDSFRSVSYAQDTPLGQLIDVKEECKVHKSQSQAKLAKPKQDLILKRAWDRNNDSLDLGDFFQDVALEQIQKVSDDRKQESKPKREKGPQENLQNQLLIQPALSDRVSKSTPR